MDFSDDEDFMDIDDFLPDESSHPSHSGSLTTDDIDLITELEESDLNDLLDVDSDCQSDDGVELGIDEDMESVSESGDPNVLERIEDMVLSFLTQLVNQQDLNTKSGKVTDNENDEPTIGSQIPAKRPRKKKKRPKIELQLVDRKKPLVDGEPAMRTLRFPRVSSSGSAKPFAQLFKVLDVIHEGLVTGIPTTKRDVYYKDVALFKNQKTVDTIVDNLAATWELQRSDLNIRAASKGLICGSGITIHLLSGEEIRGNDTEGSNIPVGEDIESFGVDEDVRWVLVVEKEAVFQTLCRLDVTTSLGLAGPGIMITAGQPFIRCVNLTVRESQQGRGYPDVATRHLVKSLADALPKRIPFVALVDCDPYGLDILSVYRYGSKSMQHENEKLAARRVKWLGVRVSDLVARSCSGLDLDCLLPLTKSDEKRIHSMLLRPGLPKLWKKELSKSLHMRRKAEIEILTALDDVNFSYPSQSVTQDLRDDAPKHPLLAYVYWRLLSFLDRNQSM